VGASPSVVRPSRSASSNLLPAAVACTGCASRDQHHDEKEDRATVQDRGNESRDAQPRQGQGPQSTPRSLRERVLIYHCPTKLLRRKTRNVRYSTPTLRRAARLQTAPSRHLLIGNMNPGTAPCLACAIRRAARVAGCSACRRFEQRPAGGVDPAALGVCERSYALHSSPRSTALLGRDTDTEALGDLLLRDDVRLVTVRQLRSQVATNSSASVPLVRE
jgi:hypothetical protein